MKEKLSDKKLREMADRLGDWIESDAIIHIPLKAKVEREEQGAWVDCKILVPWPDESTNS